MKLIFKNILDNKNLLTESTYEFIDKFFSDEEKNEILVTEIVPEYMVSIKLCEHYNIDIK